MRTRKQIIGLWLLALAATGFACGGDSEDNAPPDSGNTFVRRDAGGDDDGEDAGSEEDTDAGTADAGDEDTDVASEKEAKAKGWVVGCYKKPKTSDELLNSCATGWRLFDESLYPADWKPGQLPTLP
jgi:hypothetical protein